MVTDGGGMRVAHALVGRGMLLPPGARVLRMVLGGGVDGHILDVGGYFRRPNFFRS